MSIQLSLAEYGFIGDTKNGFKSPYLNLKFTPSGWVLSSKARILITTGELRDAKSLYAALDTWFSSMNVANPSKDLKVQEYFSLTKRAGQKRNNPITVCKEMPTPVSWTPMDAEWRNNCKKNWWSTDYRGRPAEIHPFMYLLRDRLLSFGGDQACLPTIEDDLANILLRGQFWYGDKARLMKGEPSQCHRNSCNLWRANRGIEGVNLHIATGYALSTDGMWRQHSWLVHAKPRSNQIIETTVKRIGYYGFVLTDDEAEAFESDNW